MPETTTRAYTLKLTGDSGWRKRLWETHITVNRGTQVWGDWLLTLRGGLPASLADDHPDRRVLLALSWLSVEGPATLAPKDHIVARGCEKPEERRQKVIARFRIILERLRVDNPQQWIEQCEPALVANIRQDAVWVDRNDCFGAMAVRFPGVDSQWAADTLFGFLGRADEYFEVPDADSTATSEAKDFVQKAGGWLSRQWGAGQKSDPQSVSHRLTDVANLHPDRVVGLSSKDALSAIVKTLGEDPGAESNPSELMKQIKQSIGWKGRPSKGAIALAKLVEEERISGELWEATIEKLRQESGEQASKAETSSARPDWMTAWRQCMESALGMPYRVERDYIWEHGVALDHALRRVSSAHTWIKRAEAERRRFRDDAAKIDAVPPRARQWLDDYRRQRAGSSFAIAEYVIGRGAMDGWDKVVQVWAALRDNATRRDRIDAARDVQRNLDENEKFGDIQLFAGFGDEDDDDPRPCLADDDARCVWRDEDGRPNPDILKDYVAATIARYDERRFKVPAYRHPDPLRHPVFVDYGNSRWGISYSALREAGARRRLAKKLARAKTDRTREKLQQQLRGRPDLRGVSLDVWSGERIEPLQLHWHGKRLWKDLDLDHFEEGSGGDAVTRADRLGRLVAGESSEDAVNIADVFEQKDWNGRLQAPRDQLRRLADVVYGTENGKRADPDYAKLDALLENPPARKQWERLRWFVTTSAKLRPRGPWLDYVAAGLPEGIEYKKGRSAYYLDYAANKGRKSRARLQLARLPGLRVLSLDLGHRYAAACAVWETMTSDQMTEACDAADHPHPNAGQLYVHLKRETDKIQKSGRNRGRPVTETTIYRRIAADRLPDGSPHPAPWARLERQFLIKLQGEDRPARRARQDEIDRVNEFCTFLGVPSLAEPRVDELQKRAVRLARRGLRRLGDMARVAYALTATTKPVAGGKDVKLGPQERIEYVLEALLRWQELAGSSRYKDNWAKQEWQTWIIDKLQGPSVAELPDDVPRAQRKKLENATRDQLRPVAKALADHQSELAGQLHRLWAKEWSRRQDLWRRHLRWLRRFILPRKKDMLERGGDVRRVGGLSVKRLQTIRDLYQLLKAFRMRPEPDDLRKNVPELGDESLAEFGRRILNQLERLREQRVKQLASRVVEAAVGGGRMTRSCGRDRKRPAQNMDRPCHVVVVENLERYKPEDSRLRRENRQIMNWAARNVRKYIMEGCELHGVYFTEVPPAYTSRQDSRTGAPGIRCEDVSSEILREAVRRATAKDGGDGDSNPDAPQSRFEREVSYWTRVIQRAKQDETTERQRDRVLAAIAATIPRMSDLPATFRLPHRGGELFVSAAEDSPIAKGIQADLNAASNIGLKALNDPDWEGAWWYVLVNLATGRPTPDKVKGSAVWKTEPRILEGDPDTEMVQDAKTRRKRRRKTDVYAFNPLLAPDPSLRRWMTTKNYWAEIERLISDRLIYEQGDNPF